jgi:mercuric ion transport protein
MLTPDNLKVSALEAGRPREWRPSGAQVLSIGGILAGLAAASCCVIPFLLFLAGIGGAWIGNLTALEPYRFYFAAASIGCIGYGFYRVHRKPAAACAEGSYCARPASDRLAKIGLWSAIMIVLIALVSPYVIARYL